MRIFNLTSGTWNWQDVDGLFIVRVKYLKGHGWTAENGFTPDAMDLSDGKLAELRDQAIAEVKAAMGAYL